MIYSSIPVSDLLIICIYKCCLIKNIKIFLLKYFYQTRTAEQYLPEFSYAELISASGVTSESVPCDSLSKIVFVFIFFLPVLSSSILSSTSWLIFSFSVWGRIEGIDVLSECSNSELSFFGWLLTVITLWESSPFDISRKIFVRRDNCTFFLYSRQYLQQLAIHLIWKIILQSALRCQTSASAMRLYFSF